MKNFSNTRRRLTAIGAALGAILGAGVVVAPSANAAGCYYSTCHGLEPVINQCTDATTIYDFGNGIEVRWSNACQAMWVRASAEQVRQYASVFDANLANYYVNSSGYWVQYQDYRQYAASGSATSAWTAMTPLGTNELAKVSVFNRFFTPYINTIKVHD
ncbi:hypothetical protein [Paenarthrobacter nicotinovorans]|uniref:hypothetical protein n=1 Tax=Paenarthrobacter nicotinovorans TaxID=29320 RepID=UPI00117EEAE3|nr:hypothetical protein [Paenarthrobacter nicotinovorans]